VKAILKFDLPEEQEEYNRAIKGSDAYSVLWDIAQEIFRPHRKHGYPNQELENLIQRSEELEDGELLGNRIISILEDMFYEMINDRNIELG
jgi:hypothetical protein